MNSPTDRLDRAVDRAAEVTWWNRQMTRLTDVEGIDNAQSFVENDVIERKGPYVEFVDAPAFQQGTAAEFLSELDYHDHIIEAITRELFGGDRNGSLYQHQAETISAIEANDGDNILSVPTATGKTEAFFLPILDHCLSTDEPGLKSIVLYPMKTLGVDQLNRFVTYLDEINRRRDPDDRVTIGIWDSDTPSRVGTRDHEIEAGSYVRGLECPRDDGEKLRVLGETSVGTDDHQYPWLRVTRESIRRGVDILLTGPEALDYMFVSDNPETRSILGEQPGDAPLEHVVFDEAHVWSGIQGAAISLLSRRLKSYYADRNPQITMVSATVDNPTELAADLTGSEETAINTVEFSAREFDAPGTPDFHRFASCDADALVSTLALVHARTIDEATLESEFGLSHALETLRAVGLVAGSDPVRIDGTEDWVTTQIERAIERAVDGGEFADARAVVSSERGREQVVDSVVADSGIQSGWFEFVMDSVPEVARLAAWFDEDTTGVVGFKQYDDLVERVSETGVTDPAGVLRTTMAFGRLAGVVTEKYHSFLKPPHKVFWCRDCERVARDSRCPDCGDPLPELQFCRRCHQPHVEVGSTAGSELRGGDSGAPDPSGESSFVPVGAVTVRTPVSGGECPGCGGTPQLHDIGVPTASLLSYMLTELCRVSPSKKTLVFSDSRSTAESVGDRIIGTEYGLMAETLYVDELIDRGGRADNYDLFRAVSDRLREEYWDPLIQNDINEDGTAYNFLRTLLDDIEAHAMLSNCDHLLDSALVTAAPVSDAEGLEELLVGHALYTLFAGSSNPSFAKQRMQFDGLTRGKIVDRLDSRTGFDPALIDRHLDTVLRRLLDAGVVSEVTWDEVRETIQSSTQSESVKNEVFDFVEAARETADEHDLVDDPESGVFTRIPQRDDSDLVLLPRTSFCAGCYRSYPVTDDGQALSACPNCGSELEVYRRFRETERGFTATPGYADAASEWDYAIDHWAHDVTRPLRDGAVPEYISVGIHKGNIPHTLRSAIEEGFRKDDPDVNIVSATPTMELGVDIGTLDTVAQVGIPPTLTNYVQRSGRTGRTRGSSSLVVTAIRGNHPVDSHYYGNLETFLGEFEPVRVPDPFDFDELLAGHVVTEAVAYLARNPHESNVFEKMYTIDERKENLVNFVDSVTNQLDILREFMLEERRDPVVRHVEDIFGSRGIDVFEQVFEGEGPLSLDSRMDNTFTKLTGMSGEGETNKSFTDQNSRLDGWIQQLGYLANYRSFGQQFPVNFTGANDGIQFESEGRLYDMFPGEQNDLGSVLTLHGTDYIVDDVHGTSTPLTAVAVCDNDDCERPFQSYRPGAEYCPHCDEELVETPVHGVSSVECKAAKGGQKGYSTRGLQSTFVEEPDDDAAVKLSDRHSVFGMDTRLTYGQLEVTDFVYAFERWHSRGSGKEVLRSEAVVERDDAGGSTGGSWEERMEDVEEEIYRPVGQQYFTQGLAVRFDEDAMRERFETVTHESASWPQALVSLEQALEKAIAIVAECDRSDFRVKAKATGDDVVVYIVDSRQGGNGITWQVVDRLAAVERRVREVADCDRCRDYCDECLLLARTPAHYLDNDLLDRRTLAAIVGGRP